MASMPLAAGLNGPSEPDRQAEPGESASAVRPHAWPEPLSEPARLAILERYAILDTPPEQGFDDIVMLASRICGTPIALVSLVASDRQWFKARIGTDLRETPIGQSVCAHAIGQPGLLIIPDLSTDPRTRDNTLVTAAPHLRFYAGARLETGDGVALGTLCAIDTQPRPAGLTAGQAASLEALARQVVTLLELRRLVAEQNAMLAERRRSEDRQTLLLRLTDRLRAQGSPRGRMQAAVDALGHYLGASRVGYGMVEDDGCTITVDTEYVDGVARLAGTYSCHAFGPGNFANLLAGRTSVYRDVEADSGTAGLALADYGIAAIVAVPQVHEARLRSVIFVHDRAARAWTPGEVGAGGGCRCAGVGRGGAGCAPRMLCKRRCTTPRISRG